MDSQPTTNLRRLQSTDTTRNNQVIIWILVACVVLPFIVASFLQCIFILKKRARQRRERALAQVNENPGGRLMILELLFKENVKEVTERELAEKKRKEKVLVKKRRKKTDEERKRIRGSSDVEMRGGDIPAVVESKTKWLWWGEEKVRRGSTSSDDQEQFVICISTDGLETDIDDIIEAASNKIHYAENIDASERTTEEGNEGMGQPYGNKEDVAVVTEEESVVSQVAIADESNSKRENRFCAVTDLEAHGRDYVPNNELHSFVLDSERGDALPTVDDSHAISMNQQELSVSADENDYSPLHEAKIPITTNAEKDPFIMNRQTMELSVDDKDFRRTTVQLAPRIRSHCSVGDALVLPEVREPSIVGNNGPGDISPISPCFENGDDTWIRDDNNAQPRSSSFPLIIPNLSENDVIETEQVVRSTPPIFRNRDSDEKLSCIALEQSISNETEVASHVDDTYKNDHVRETVIEKSASADKVPSYKLNSVESYKTDGSSISYFSYEDVSIGEDESEMCTVCICPYEEGDIRVFSKHCSHVFHKDCIFEWLVKGHNECPCCRADMVTKSEIKETSASLMGTERLTHAMRTVMVEAPPFQERRGPRLPRHMLALARREARRESRASTQIQTNTTIPPQSPNAHWLWTARQQVTNSVPATTAAPASPAIYPANNGNNHNVDWLWTVRFDNLAMRNNSPSRLRSTRSSDAMHNNHATETMASRSSDTVGNNRSNENALASRSYDALDSRRGPNVESSSQALHHHATAGSLVTGRYLHPHWSSQNSVARSFDSQQRRRNVDTPLVEISPRPAASPFNQIAS